MEFPGLTADAARKYLSKSNATIRGHLHGTSMKPMSVTNSTISKINNESGDNPINTPTVYFIAPDDMDPKQEPKLPCELFCTATLADVNSGKIYTNLPGKYLIRSYKRH